MNHKKRWTEKVIILMAVAIWILIVYPKPRVIGGLGGFYGPGKTAYREDYTCIGVKVDVPPLAYGADGQFTYLCFGIITDRVCAIETYNMDDTITRTPVTCKD